MFKPDIAGMETLASLLVGKPQNILVVAIAFLVGYLVPRFTALGNRRRFGSLLIASVAWGVYAAWEWLVQAKTPEAKIRVDLPVRCCANAVQVRVTEET
jgi:hypothetical protein